jgi:hypothetical protein
MDAKQPNQQETPAPPVPIELTPEQVRQVAQRVYAMLRRDLQIERERRPQLEQRDSHG